ncbi:hypothetical protein BYT27DRAFT_7242712 [Phlegmacium glaucopus]|nr:hypothetical protein BYT27DRAFT_7242712 [Phlegmacium glaucopus]
MTFMTPTMTFMTLLGGPTQTVRDRAVHQGGTGIRKKDLVWISWQINSAITLAKLFQDIQTTVKIVQFFFLGPVAGLTNQALVQDSDPGAPLLRTITINRQVKPIPSKPGEHPLLPVGQRPFMAVIQSQIIQEMHLTAVPIIRTWGKVRAFIYSLHQENTSRVDGLNLRVLDFGVRRSGAEPEVAKNLEEDQERETKSIFQLRKTYKI